MQATAGGSFTGNYYNRQHDMLGRAIVWWIILFVIAFLFLIAIKPYWVQYTTAGQPNGQINYWTAIIAAIVIALVILVIGWIIRYAGRPEMSY